MPLWEKKLKTAAYVSADGDRVEFQYETVSRGFEKKTAAFEFPDADGTYVQDLGKSGRRYPVRAIFWGDYHDVEADAFEAILGARGVGKLTLPLYGTANVVPFGEIKRTDGLDNQSIVEVTFWETIGLVYPTPQTDFSFSVSAAMAAYSAAMAAKLAASLVTDTTGLLANIKAAYNAALDAVQNVLIKMTDGQENAARSLSNITKSVDRGIDILISDPLTLAFQTSMLMQAPAQYVALTGDRLAAYYDLATALITGNGAVVTPSTDARESNRFHVNDQFVSDLTAAAALAAVNTKFTTRAEAMAAADTLLSLFEDAAAWREANFAALEQVDDGGAYQQLQNLIALTAGYLVQLSFSLKQERRLTLTRARTAIDLVAELYGDVDGMLDFFIASNRLTGSEILEIPKGRSVVFYV